MKNKVTYIIIVGIISLAILIYVYYQGKKKGGVTNVNYTDNNGESVDIASASQKIYQSFGWFSDGNVGLTILQTATPTEITAIDAYFQGNYGTTLKKYADDCLNSFYDWGDSGIYSKVISEISRMAS